MSSIELSSVDLNLLVAFDAIFELRSVTAAAQRLHIGQPAMSAALGRLRILFKDDLFIRLGRDMQPTLTAQAIAPDIASALQQIRLTLQSSQQFNPKISEQSFVIGCSDYISIVVLPALLQICRHSAPSINFRLISYEKNQLRPLLEQNVMAIALGSTFHNLPQHIKEESLMKEQFVGICRKQHPALQDRSMSLGQFTELPHALFTLRQDAVGAVDQALRALNLSRRIILTTPYLLTLSAIIADSETVAAVPSRLAQQLVAQGLVDSFEIPLDLKPWYISMFWSSLSEKSLSYQWLRQTIHQLCEKM